MFQIRQIPWTAKTALCSHKVRKRKTQEEGRREEEENGEGRREKGGKIWEGEREEGRREGRKSINNHLDN